MEMQSMQFLRSILKVFDTNYVTDREGVTLAKIDPSNRTDLDKALQQHVVPEFRSWSEKDRNTTLAALRKQLPDPNENFSSLFDSLDLCFDVSRRQQKAFMAALLAVLEGSQE